MVAILEQSTSGMDQIRTPEELCLNRVTSKHGHINQCGFPAVMHVWNPKRSQTPKICDCYAGFLGVLFHDAKKTLKTSELSSMVAILEQSCTLEWIKSEPPKNCV